MTPRHWKKEVGKRLENDGLDPKEETENTGLVEKDRAKLAAESEPVEAR